MSWSRRAFVACACVLLLSRARAGQAADHPLEPLSAAEIQAAFELTLARFRSDSALPHEPLRFPLVSLAEPDKALVRGWTAGKPFPRRAELQVLHYPSNRLWTVLVDLQRKRVESVLVAAVGSQPAITAEEYLAVDALVRAYEPWQRAIRARAADPARVHIDTWAPGEERLPFELSASPPLAPDARIVRCLAFDRGAEPKAGATAPVNPYDRPIEGVIASVDLNARRVIGVIDSGLTRVIADDGNAHTQRTLRPLRVQQPQGTDLQLQGHAVRWHDWQFYVVLHPREGLVIYDVRYRDGQRLRSIAYRMALSEIFVPYGLADATWSWRSAFDVGEYNAGMTAQRLEVDRDVPENAQFLNGLIASDLGPTAEHPSGSRELPARIALYERDGGILWTRTDPGDEARDTRRARELVVTWNCWLGNYVYGFDWIFKLDGSIEVDAQLTGTTLNRGTSDKPEASAPKVAKDARGAVVAAPDHQHFLSFRLDLDVDGPTNRVMEMEAAHLPVPGFDGAFDAVTTRLNGEGFRDVDPLSARHWHVESASSQNAFGKPTSYALEPGEFAVPYAAAGAASLRRAPFALHQLWLTRYRPNELYAAGQFPNQAQRNDGVAQYTTPAESLDAQDVVVWYTTGFTHLSRPEDYPVMSSERIGFKLQPRGFFARNPALDVADQAKSR